MDIQATSARIRRLSITQEPKRIWPFAVLGLILLGFLAAPWPLWEKAWAVGYGICAQRPAHSYFAAGVPLPVEARMVGIFLGWLVSTLIIIARGRGTACSMAPAPLFLVLLGLIGIMGIDGINATLTDANLPHLYQPQNPLRLFTGFGAGIAAGVILLPAFNMSLWRRYDARAPLAGWRDLAILLLVCVPLSLLIMAQVGLLLYPLAISTMLGILGIFTMINMVFSAFIARREYSSQNWLDAGPLLISGFLMTVVELGLLSWFKWWMLMTTGAQML